MSVHEVVVRFGSGSAALEWLTKPCQEYEVSRVLVTSEVASVWLTRNTRNRNPIGSRVEEWSKTMGDGRWITKASTLDFGTSGTLFNGQHRLMAVVKGDHSVEMMVRRNCPVELLGVLDTGTPRTPAQVLKIEHGINTGTRKQSAIVCAAALVDHGYITGGFRVTKDTLKAAIDEFGADYESVFEAMKRDSGRLSNAGLMGSLIIAYRSVPKDVERFAAELHNGAELKVGSPVLTLRDRVLGLRNVSGGAVRDEINRMTFSALSAYVRGERRMSIKITNEASRERFIDAWKKASAR